MNEVWKRLEAWLNENLPETLAGLNKGCTEADIVRLERETGIALPDSFRTFYSMHDGQRLLEGAGLFYGIELLPLSDILRAWNVWLDVIEWAKQTGNDMDESQISLMPGKVKALYANDKWIPFASFLDSNHLGLDFDPGPEGKIGQVINFGRDEEQKAVLAHSFGEFIDRYIAGLESGEAVIRYEEQTAVLLPKKFNWRFEGAGTRLLGPVAHRFIEEPSRDEQERLGILL